MNFELTRDRVIKWGEDRELYTGSSAQQQVDKLQEELGELAEALANHSTIDAIDAIGDMIVVLTHIARFLNTDIVFCYISAYEEIKDRKGKMINGLFVKEKG